MPLHTAPLLALLLAFGCSLAGSAQARLTRLHIDQREVVAGGQSFGAAGAYERISGTADFEVDPKDPHNAVVFDLDKAPRNAHGMVEFSADMAILKPVDAAKGSRTLFFDSR